MSSNSDNWGMGVVAGILLAVLVGVAAWHFMGPGASQSHQISISTPGGSITADVKE